MCSRKDVRFINIKNGRLKRIFTGLLENKDDEIAAFRSINNFKNFIIGNHKGQILEFNYNAGEYIKAL